MAHQIMPPDTWVKASQWANPTVEVRWDSYSERVWVTVRNAPDSPMLVLTWAQWLQLRTGTFMTGGSSDGNPWSELVEGENAHECYQGHCPQWPDDVAAAATVDADER